MITGIRAGITGYRHFLRQSYLYIWANVLWALLSLPLVTSGAAWAGLCRMVYHAQRKPTAEISDVWDGFKAHWRGGLVISLLGILIVAVNVVNLLGYQRAPGALAQAGRFIWVLAIVAWFGLQLYAFPLLAAMKQPNIMGAYRNAAIMFIQNPGFSLGVLLSCLPLIVISVIFPVALFMLSGVAAASIGNSAVTNRLIAAGIQAAPAPAIPDPVMLDDQIY
ncbi:MAG: DUF624 domain-containing protein [Pleurocapsa minor GSE-CHR-MK-17-07R]|jgi:uncharacterized membrane protein YesL|nr:DUF624 domain-containing protein [Pleurocapsa minor GSE-CHR-MK 17-07R]